MDGVARERLSLCNDHIQANAPRHTRV